MNVFLTRGQLLGRGAKSGAALVLSGAAVAAVAGAASADPLPASDLAYARLLVGVELLGADFYAQAVAASTASTTVQHYLERALLNEQEHYTSVAGILSGAGQAPAVSADIDFSYPAGTFASEKSILRAGNGLESLMLGTYLGAIGGMQTNAFKTGLAQIAACEAQHSSYFATRLGGTAFHLSFPPALTVQQASDAMAAFTA
jgi:hypothetical protein